MRTRPAAVALTASLLLSVAPAAADEGPQVTDPCGDTVLYVDSGGQTVSAPDPRDRPHDIRSVTFTSVYDDGEEKVLLGMDVALRLCGPASLPGREEQLRVSWDIEDPDYDCHEWVMLFRGSVLGSLLTYVEARYVQRCPGPEGGLLGDYRLWQERLSLADDLLIAGDTVTWSLRLERLPEFRRAQLQPGTVWSAPWARTSGPGPCRTSNADVGGAGVTAATACDQAGPGRDVTVGG